MHRATLALVLALAGLGCGASSARTPALSPIPLESLEGAVHSPKELAEGAKVSVFVFFSAHCPCQAAHDARLRELDARYKTRGVKIFIVDSEVSASTEADAREARARGYAFPVLLDKGAAFANSVGAEFATFTIVVDDQGVVRYRGGIDSDRMHLTDDAEPYLANAIDDLLAGKSPRVSEGKVLGCSLRKS